LSRRTALAVVLALVAGGSFAPGAAGETFVVTKLSDPAPNGCKKNDCSLREAIIRANSRAGADTVVLPNRRKAYRLARPGRNEDNALTGDLDIVNDPLVVKHRGKGRATVNGRGIDRVFDVLAGAPATFRKLVIKRGRTTEGTEGGGILANANVKVLSSRIVRNRSSDDGGGIGLQGSAGLRLIRSSISRNRTGDSEDGGAFQTGEGAILVRRSRLTNNVAGDDSGAIHYTASQASRIVKSTIAGNRAAWGGGAITQVTGGAEPPLRIVDSTISGNRGVCCGGGAIQLVRGVLRITNSTLAANSTDGNGGAIHSIQPAADVELNAVTVARNVADAENNGVGSGAGLYRNDAAAFVVANSLLGLNRLGSGQANDCDGAQKFDTGNHNLISTTAPANACDGFGPASGPNDLLNLAPKIGKLRRNGGPTTTIALRKGSPAINKADPASTPARDQRGKRRGPKKDIGAYERRVGK